MLGNYACIAGHSYVLETLRCSSFFTKRTQKTKTRRGDITMVLLDNDSFLSGLTKMFNSTKTKGSVQVTFKRCKSRFRRHMLRIIA